MKIAFPNTTRFQPEMECSLSILTIFSISTVRGQSYDFDLELHSGDFIIIKRLAHLPNFFSRSLLSLIVADLCFIRLRSDSSALF